MADEEIYTIEAGIAQVQDRDAYLNSYRVYTGPENGIHGVPMHSMQQRPRADTPPGDDRRMSSLNGFRSSSHRRDVERQTSETSETNETSCGFGGGGGGGASGKVLAVVAAFLCFCPMGLVALVYSCRAQLAQKEGKSAKAATLAKTARDMTVASVILGTCLALFGLLILIIAFLPGVHQ